MRIIACVTTNSLQYPSVTFVEYLLTQIIMVYGLLKFHLGRSTTELSQLPWRVRSIKIFTCVFGLKLPCG